MTNRLRLNRYLAASGIASRRRCDDLIREGRVRINGQLVVELGARVEPGVDEIEFDGRVVRPAETIRTLILNKPPEVLVAARDTRGRTTVMDLLRELPERVFPVGRLDYRSEGLLLFTNDGELAYRLAHPSFKVEKLYHVDVDGVVAPDQLEALSAGVMLDDGPTQPAGVRVLTEESGKTRLEIVLREGRKRQIRRMLALFEHRVTRLCRVRFGPLAMAPLSIGAWRELTPNEVGELRAAVELPVGESS